MTTFRDLVAALRLLANGADRTAVWRLCAANLLAISAGALAGLAPLALKEMVDGTSAATKPHAVAPMAMFGTAYIACLGLGRLLTEIRPWLMSGAEQHLYARLRQRYFKHLLDLPLAFHLDKRTGAVVHGLQQGLSGYQIILFHAVNSIVPVLVEAVTVTVVLMSLGQPALTATFAATALAYFAAMARGTSGMAAAAQAVSDAGSDAHARFTDGLMNYEPIKCFGAERRTLHGFELACHTLEHCWAQLQRRRLRLGFAVAAVFMLSMGTSLALATHSVANGTLTVGGFVLANVYMLQVLRPLEALSGAVRDVCQGLAFVRPLLGVLATAPETSHKGASTAHGAIDVASPGRQGAAVPRRRRRTPPHVSIRGIRLAFDAGAPVLDDFSLEVPPGRSTAIVGASGCGKSSLVRLLLRLREPDGGDILLDGVAIDTLPIDALRSLIAVVPQDVMLLNTTIGANIGLGKDGATPTEIERAARLAGLHDFIAALPHGYDTPIGERGLKLSGGERQRIAIARAILRDPEIFVFDEATSMLDGPTERTILRNLRQISAGRTTITIAHRLSAIQDADLIAVLGDGRVIEQGDHATLLARDGAYAAMWRAQQAAVQACQRG
jgi:ABC-type multidrug transport system fused ATPase/permease subunit